MKIYLLRHATAADVAPSDAERPLTAEGREEARITGRALCKLGGKPGVIGASPLRRAQETAEIVARELGFHDQIATCEELCNGRSPGDLMRRLKQFGAVREFLLVGHMPSLADDLAVLLGAEDAGGFSFGRSTIACVELFGPITGRGELRWFLRQAQQRLLL